MKPITSLQAAWHHILYIFWRARYCRFLVVIRMLYFHFFQGPISEAKGKCLAEADGGALKVTYSFNEPFPSQWNVHKRRRWKINQGRGPETEENEISADFVPILFVSVWLDAWSNETSHFWPPDLLTWFLGRIHFLTRHVPKKTQEHGCVYPIMQRDIAQCPFPSQNTEGGTHTPRGTWSYTHTHTHTTRDVVLHPHTHTTRDVVLHTHTHHEGRGLTHTHT